MYPEKNKCMVDTLGIDGGLHQHVLHNRPHFGSVRFLQPLPGDGESILGYVVRLISIA